MGIKRHRPEEIVTKLRQVEVLVGQGLARIDAIREDVPHLRIINQDLWNRVKVRQSVSRRRVMAENNSVRAERARRPR